MLKNRGFVRLLMLVDRLSIFTRNNCPEWVKLYLDKSSPGYIAVKAFPFGSLVCLCGIQRIANIQALLLFRDNNADLTTGRSKEGSQKRARRAHKRNLRNIVLLIFIQLIHSFSFLICRFSCRLYRSQHSK